MQILTDHTCYYCEARVYIILTHSRSILFNLSLSATVRNDWNRVMTTAFNGASNIVQSGGLACLDDAGLKEIDTLIDYYLENAEILRSTFVELGFDVYGGLDAPYVFVHMKGHGSWESFSTILETIQVVTIPGAGFGPGGEGFLRMSAFAPRESCIEACNRFREMYKKK